MGCRRKEREREEERAKREGKSYKTLEERAKEAKDSRNKVRDENEAEILDNKKFDPDKDYYKLLGLDRAASASEVRNAYKKFALLYHPDKHKSESDEQKKAIAEKFREIAAAFDVLTNEDIRGIYDKCRDYMEANPGKGLPTLSPEEAAQMQRGAGELSKLRRMGPKLKKHEALHRQVEISLPKLNFGCTKAVEVERRRVDYAGKEYISSKTFHLVIRKGSREGDTLVYEDEGEESVDTHPGDLIFILRSKAHPVFRRKGEKDIEIFASAVSPGDIVDTAMIQNLSGKEYLLPVHCLREALENHGKGGMWHHVLEKQGMFDALSPWDAPPGDLHIYGRYPPIFLSEKSITKCINPGKIYLVGSSSENLPVSIAAKLSASRIYHAIEAKEMISDYEDLIQSHVLCLQFSCSKSSNVMSAGSHAAYSCFLQHIHSLGITKETVQCSDITCLDDKLWTLLHDADAIVLDLPLSELQDVPLQEEVLLECRTWLEQRGLMHLLWQQHMKGCDIIAMDGAVSLLGNDSLSSANSPVSHPILPWYAIRPGGGSLGWDSVCTCAKSNKIPCVGVLEESVYSVDSVTGEAEMIVAPPTEVLVKKAAWSGPSYDTVEEAEEDWGYLAAFQNY